MRYLFQRPHPDELLSSVWVRSSRRAGLPIGIVTRELTAGRKWSPSFFNAAHLEDIAPLVALSPLELLWKHTVFPYATAFFEPSVFESAMASALATGHAAVGMGAVTQSVSDFVRYRRYCTTCARDDLKNWGESYWHRAHNLPGVLVCHQHGMGLRGTDMQTAGTRSWSYTLPHELEQGRLLRHIPGRFDTELVKRSVEALNRPPPGRNSVIDDQRTGRLPIWYRDELVRAGLLSPQGQVNVQKLAAWARSMVGGKVERLGFADKDVDLDWLGLMVRPGSGIPFVPLKHFLFETALALAAGRLAETGLEGPTGGVYGGAERTAKVAGGHRANSMLDHTPSGPTGLTSSLIAQRDKEYAAAVSAVVQLHKLQGKQLRVCDALTLAGCWCVFRHGRANFPLLSKVVLRLRRSPTSARQIDGDYRVRVTG